MSVFNFNQLNKPNSGIPFIESDGSESMNSYSIVPSNEPTNLKLRLKKNNQSKSNVVHAADESENEVMDVSSATDNVVASTSKSVLNGNEPKSHFVYVESDSENELMDASIATNNVMSSTCDSATHDMPTSSAAVSGPKRSRKISNKGFVELDHEFMCGDKSNSKVLSTKRDRHLYTRNGSCVHGSRYRCRERTCRAFVIYNETTKTCFQLPSAPAHKHIKNNVEAEYWNLVCKNEMRALCSDLTTLASGKQIASVESIFTTVKNK